MNYSSSSNFETVTPQETAIKISTLVTASLSLIGALFIIISGIKFKDLLKSSFAMRICFILSICDLFGSLGFLIEPLTGNYTICILQAYMIQYFPTSGIMWIFCFSYALFLNVVKQKSDEDLNGRMKIFSILSFGIPIFTLMLPIFMRAFGSQHGVPWCWITSNFKILRLACFYSYVFITIIFNTILFIVIARHIIKYNKIGIEKKLFWRLSLYLLSFIICWSPATAHRIYQYVTGRDLYFLQLLHAILGPSHGFINSIVYGLMLPILRERYKYLLVNSVEITPFILVKENEND